MAPGCRSDSPAVPLKPPTREPVVFVQQVREACDVLAAALSCAPEDRSGPMSDGGQHDHLCELFEAQRTDGLLMKTRCRPPSSLTSGQIHTFICVRVLQDSFTNHLSSMLGSYFLLPAFVLIR